MSVSKIHPINLDNMEKSVKGGDVKPISRKGSFLKGFPSLEPSYSSPSLSVELVEAALHDGQYRITSESAQEVAMWCGMISFLIMGGSLMIFGLFIALTH